MEHHLYKTGFDFYFGSIVSSINLWEVCYFNRKMKAQELSKVFKCKICDKVYKWRPSLRNHISFVHEEKRFQCSHCDFQASHKWYLKSHVKSIHEGIKYTCNFCKYQTSSRGTFYNHNKSAHERENENIIIRDQSSQQPTQALRREPRHVS